MKTLPAIIAFVLGLSATSPLFAKNINIYKVNGGSDDKFYSLSEQHSSGGLFSEESHTLTCTNPGTSPCVWTTPPGPLRISYVEGLIANGSHAGSLVDTVNNLRVTVTWSATNSQDCEIHELQEELFGL